MKTTHDKNCDSLKLTWGDAPKMKCTCSVQPSRFNFRAWDKVSKKFVPNDSYLISFSGEITNGEGLNIDYKNDLILMQSTGLLDKNGKEIFEGNIIKNISANYTQRVCFEDGTFVKVNNGKYEPINEEIEWFKIVGNIFNQNQND